MKISELILQPDGVSEVFCVLWRGDGVAPSHREIARVVQFDNGWFIYSTTTEMNGPFVTLWEALARLCNGGLDGGR